MAVDLHELLDPRHTAVLTMELQRGVVGDLAVLPQLAEEVAARDTVAHAARVARAARAAGARVVHCTAEFRPDRAGSAENAPFLRALARGPAHLVAGTPAVEVVPELGPDPADLISSRRHGLTPFPGTDLDQTLRNVGITTVVATGVSANIGIPGLVMGAVDRGYRVAVVTDAIAGVPRDYADAVVRHTLALLATLVTADEVAGVWGTP